MRDHPKLGLPMVLCVAAALAAAAGPSCKSKAAEDDNCTPGSDGSYVNETFAAVGDYCMVKIDGGKIVPRPTVVPYDVSTPLFSDYAAKSRTVWVPPGKQIKYTDTGQLDFPTGTLITKSFGLAPDMRKPDAGLVWIETRMLIKGEDGWHVATYEWDEAQKKGDIRPGGIVREQKFIRPDGKDATAQYLVPGQVQCKKCHEQDTKVSTLGLRADQLNHDFTYPDGTRENQLAHWQKIGILAGGPTGPGPKLPQWDDPGQGNVEKRARAYLDANCAYCHNDKGEARTTGLFLTFETTEAYKLGTCKTPVAAGKATSDYQYDVVPGHPEKSILVYRMNEATPAIAMPEIGRSLVHDEAVKLVSDWITGLPGGCGP
jgi:uncharacterized repeat protein (TIGR03806 family)